jgi:glycerophosphoryl diester phosphodiesterase
MGRVWADLRFGARQVIEFQLLVQAAVLAVLGPFLTWVGRKLVLVSGEPVVSNFDLASFAISPLGLGYIVITGGFAGAILLAELAGLSWIAAHAIERRQVTLGSTIGAVVRRLPALLALSVRVLARLALLALPFLLAALLLWHTLLGSHDINYYLALHPPEWQRALLWGALLALAFAAASLWQLGRWLFAVPAVMCEGVPARRALTQSVQLTHGQLAHLLGALLLWWLLLGTLGIALGTAGHALEARSLGWAGMQLGRVLTLLAIFVAAGVVVGFLQGALLITGHQFFVTRRYAERVDPANWTVAAPAPTALPAAAWLFPALALLAALGFGASWWLAARPLPEATVAVTAHRGDSKHAPENTLAAFRAAIAARADYSELDVQRTRDGAVVVLHDGDLMRMAGDPRRIGELTLQDLEGIDIGRRFGAAFAGEHVPLLASVIDLVRGHMRLNVELKYNGPDPGLAAAAVEVLRSKDFLDQVVITSLSAAALTQVKSIEPRLRTGLIVSAEVGDVARADADFLSLNSARATSAVLRRAHAVGKEVHVWTVNRAEVMLRMIERGVDNIITDDPALAVLLLEKRSALDSGQRFALRLRVLFGAPPAELLEPQAVETL